MIRPEALFVDRQGPAHQGLRLVQSIGVVQQSTEVIERYSHAWIIRPEALFDDRQGPAQQRLRPLVSCLMAKPLPILITQMRKLRSLRLVSSATLKDRIEMGSKPKP